MVIDLASLGFFQRIVLAIPQSACVAQCFIEPESKEFVADVVVRLKGLLPSASRRTAPNELIKRIIVEQTARISRAMRKQSGCSLGKREVSIGILVRCVLAPTDDQLDGAHVRRDDEQGVGFPRLASVQIARLTVHWEQLFVVYQ